MDDKIQQRLDAIMGPAKKARPSQSTAKLPDNSQWLLVFSALLAFRIVNALTIKTFFQPDEYFQALEPAWKTAFGGGSGAWTTWVRKTHPIWQTFSDIFVGMARRSAHGGAPLDLCHRLQSRRCHVDAGRRHSSCQGGGYAHCT
jgi:hypothetical protein